MRSARDSEIPSRTIYRTKVAVWFAPAHRPGNVIMNRRRAALVWFVALVLAGCAGRIIDDRMQAFIGQPASHVFEKLGAPDAEDEVVGRKFYVWETESLGSFLVPVSGTGPVHDANRPSNLTFFVHEFHSYHHVCKFRLFVDMQDLVTGYDLEGDGGGCGTFANRLRR